MKAVLVNFGQTFREGMSSDDMYEAARGDWVFQKQKPEQAEYLLAYAKGRIREVYRKSEKWMEIPQPGKRWNRWRFTGVVAEEDVRDKFLNATYQWPQYNANPVKIVDFTDLVNRSGFANGLKRDDVEWALGYIAQHGVRGNYGILYLSGPARQSARHLAVEYEGKYFAVKEAVRVGYAYTIDDKPKGEDGKFTDVQLEEQDAQVPMPDGAKSGEWTSQMAAKRLEELGFKVRDMREGDAMTKRYVNLLMQFHQIILYGPPGTGKTYAAKGILAEIFGEDKWMGLQGKQWDIVQFHPSYNYEDFVRGVQVETRKGQVVYETINKTFGDMCGIAGDNSEIPYALIIDEINRANVSAVLGELIYALEYRGTPVKTPYLGDIKIPKNLYIIGTMNTADRTIGQIDYAVRRRFAFVECLPDEELVEDKSPGALHVYQEVQKFFHRSDNGGYLSSDFDADDVRIGHSYFLADKEQDIPPNQQIANKIIWQVVPILHEYVKDGILLMQKNAEGKIDAIERIKELAEELAKKPQAGESEVPDLPAKSGYYFVNTGQYNNKTGTTKRFRSWEYCRKLGFLAAGGISGSYRYADGLRKLQPGQEIFAFLNDGKGNKGFVGFGKVIAAARPVRNFDIDGTPILEYQIGDGTVRKKYPKLEETADSEECEWFLRVEWIKTFSAEDAVSGNGNRNPVWQIQDKEIIAGIKKGFGI